MSELKLFIGNLITQAKSDRLLIKKIGILSLQGGLDHFMLFFESLPEKERKKSVIDSALKNKIILALAKLENFEQSALDKLLSYGFTFTVKDYETIKNKAKFKNGFKELENNIYSDSNPRLKQLQNFMQLYEKSIRENKKIEPEIFKEYAEKLAFKNIEREKHTSTKSKLILVGKTYKRVTHTTTRNLRTQAQKDFDFVFPSFAKFLSNNIQEDFLQVLSLLDLDFSTFLTKTAKFDKDFAVLKKIIDKIDLIDYTSQLTIKEKDKFHKSFETYLISNGRTVYPDIMFTKKTQEATSYLFDLIFKLQEAGFKNQEIKNIFDLYTEKLQATYSSVKSGGDIVYEEAYKIFKPMSKKNKERAENFLVNYEKDLLSTSLQIAPTTKIKIHKL